MTALPPASQATDSAATEGDVKNFLTSMRSYLAELLGTSGTVVDARAALGLAGALVSSFNSRVGAVNLTTTDISVAGGSINGHLHAYVPLAAGVAAVGQTMYLHCTTNVNSGDYISGANLRASKSDDIYSGVGHPGTWQCVDFGRLINAAGQGNFQRVS